MNDLALLAPRGLTVLPQSHLVPVDVWLRDASGALLHLTGRGTTLRLRAYDATDLTAVLLRSECDCRAHREAGAAHRVALRPGATPVSEAAEVKASAKNTPRISFLSSNIFLLPHATRALAESPSSSPRLLH